MNKQALLDKIKELDNLTQDERAYLLELINTKKKYGLVWEQKTEEVEEQLRTHLPVLKEVVERRIVSESGFSGLKNEQNKTVDSKAIGLFDELNAVENQENHSSHGSDDVPAPNHILIEGDNLHALTALTFTHEGKIDVIYIDPPYNTGNKDFKYNDSFVDKEDSFRHSKWLSFMHKRLEIAKRLLSTKGVIFISIDDNEQAQLKLLCDEVFGEDNFITQFLWEKTSTPPALSKKVRKKMEYVLCYEKIRDNSSYSIGKVDGGDVPLLNSGNSTTKLKFPEGSIRFNLPNGTYYDDPNRKIRIISDALIVDESTNKNKVVMEGNFKWKQEMLDKEILLGTYFIIKTDLFSIRFQRREDNLKTKTPTNRLDKELQVGTNEDAKKEIEDLKINYFDYPKPVSLLKLLVNLKFNHNSIILDFFAGSGTTLHATMQLNAEDGGSRQCILVTNNENNICEEVTYERNKRVIQGYTNAKGVEVAGLTQNNLRYYRCELMDREPSLKNKRKLTRLATELLCIKENCYQPLALDVAGNWIEAYKEEERIFVMIYDDLRIEESVDIIRRIHQTHSHKHHKIKVYVFSNGQYPYTEDFEEVLPIVELCALPDAIYKAYQHVLPKKSAPRHVVPEEEMEADVTQTENA